MTDFGSSLFKVHSGVASYADILSVLKKIVEDEQVRSRCAGLSNLVSEIDESVRRENCAAMVSVYFANFASSLRPGPPPPGPYMATVALIKYCSPPSSGAWRGHVFSDSDRKGRVTRATFSNQVGEVLLALEQLWGVPKYLIVNM